MFNRLFDRLMRGVMWFGACLLGALMTLISVDVCMRYFFHSPIQGSYEIVEVFMGMLSPVVILYCAWHRGRMWAWICFSTGFPARRREPASSSPPLCAHCSASALPSARCS